MPATIFESEMLAARVEGYNPSDLDALCAAGDGVWCGVAPIGERDGRLALYLTDHLPRLRARAASGDLDARAKAIVAHLESEGASFFAAVHEAAGAGVPGETGDAIWNRVWKGLITNETFHALRAYTRPPERRARKAQGKRRSPGPTAASPEPTGSATPQSAECLP